MKTATLSKQFAGYGHYRLTLIVEDGGKFSATTNDMSLIDRFNHVNYETADDPEDYLEAIRQAAEFVLDQNGYEYSAVTVYNHPRWGNVIEIAG